MCAGASLPPRPRVAARAAPASRRHPVGSCAAVPKDRTRRRRLARDVRIVIERSSAHPVAYAIMLLVQRGGAWRTVRTFDNAHASEEHHEHGYAGSEKQPPAVTHGPVNEAMYAAELKLLRDWRDIVDEWEGTR
jgi:hypothetical protein